jgi:Flp pilus assembly protein TadD
VINKMLRDLDSRQAAAASPAANPPTRAGIARDTLIVGTDAKSNDVERGSRWVALVLAAMVVLLVAAAAAWWYLNQNVLAPRRLAQVPLAPKATPAKPITAEAPAAVPSAAASAPLPAVAVSVPAAVAPAMAAPLPVPVLAVPTSTTAAPPADMSLRMDSNFRSLPSPEKTAKPKPVAPARPVAEQKVIDEQPSRAKAVKPSTKSSLPTATLPPSALRQAPAQEALAQAQSLWNAGSHQEAIDLLYQALTAVERSSAAGSLAGNKPVLASLVRELSRMELAEGRVSQTLELLTRLEPALSGVADIWAIRGNAAQRLGRHAESVAAYQRALKLQPNEPRWQLGAAVSLAAQGQTAAAAELAKKARAAGALSPEVATYLRQLGVPLREQ